MMTARRRRWLAGALGSGLVGLLLVIAAFDNVFRAEVRPATTQRAVELYVPPPPPPPPARRSDARSGGSTGAQLTLRSSRAPVSLDTMRLDIQFAAAEIGSLNIAGLGEGIGLGTGDGRGDGSGTGFGLATLSELDQAPMVVSAPTFPFPEEATARGLSEFEIEYYILIDEQGRTSPLVMVKNPFPALSPEFLEWASHVRFSPPTRLGIPVRTEYSWPVKIKR